MENVQRDVGLWVFLTPPPLQKQAWSGHKMECKCLRSLLPRRPTDSVRLAARVLFALVCFCTFSANLLNVHKENYDDSD